MRILRKKGEKAIILGEGRIYSKSQIRLKEDVDANIGTANGLQQAQMKARKLMNQNSSVTSASADAGHLDGQSDTSSGEGMELKLPVNATGQQLAQAQRLTQNQSNNDMQVTFTKPQVNGQIQNESRIIEMRNNSIPFTKSEFKEFLKKL